MTPLYYELQATLLLNLLQTKVNAQQKRHIKEHEKCRAMKYRVEAVSFLNEGLNIA